MSSGTSPSRYHCDHFECGKSFRRAEHLTRHKLNHTNLTIPCPQCSRLFYRRDLLHRHLILKHGKTSAAVRGADSDVLPQAADSPQPARHGNTLDPAQFAPGAHETEHTDPFNPNLSPVGNHIHGIDITEAALPMTDDLFQFSSPSLDLTDDWGWLQQSPLPVFPAGSNPVVLPTEGAEMPGVSFVHSWEHSSLRQDFVISQELYGFLVTLTPVVEANHPMDAQDVHSILNSGFAFIMKSIPIFHEPTFNFNIVSKELCVALFCVGLLISQEPGLYHVGCALLAETRLELLQYVEKNTIHLTDLAVLQAMLLVEFSGMFLADRTSVELSDIFHGTLVTVSRRLGIFEVTYSNTRLESTPLDHSSLVEHESAKRLAYSVFVLDVGHALFFGHKRSILSIYSMKLELPSQDENWQARQQSGTIQRPKFNILCQDMLSKPEGHTSLPLNLSQFSNLLLLLSLASVVLDLLQRQQDPFFDTRQARLHLGFSLPAIYSRIMAGPEGPMKLHGRTVYHITVIALCTPLDDLERAANDGFSRTGRTPKQHTRAAIIRLLTRHKVGPETARHALQLLKLYPSIPLEASSNEAVGNYAATPGVSSPCGSSPYETSALYFGALTLWAYVIGRVGDDDVDDDDVEEHIYITDRGMHHSPDSGASYPANMAYTVLLDDMEKAIGDNDGAASRSYWRKIIRKLTTTLALRRNSNAQEYSQVLGSLSDSLSI